MQRNKDPQQQQQGPLRRSVQSGQSEPQRQSGQSAQSQLPQQQQMQQPQQQQQQQQQGVPSTQPGSTVAQSPAASAQAQPGFFGRLFGRKQQQQQQAVNAPHDPNAPHQQQQQQHGTAPVVEAPNAARCCPSKPLPPEQLDKLMQAPVAPSRCVRLHMRPCTAAQLHACVHTYIMCMQHASCVQHAPCMQRETLGV